MNKRMTAFVASLLLSISGVVGLAASPALAVTTYHYAIGEQNGLVADGAAVNLTAEDPQLDATHDGGGSHSLAELAVASDDRKDYIEFGWRKVAGGVPRLFSFHRVNGSPMTYNACTDYASEPFNINDPIPATMITNQDNPRFQVVHSGANWWLAFNLKWVCYYPDTIWTSAGRTFNKVNTVQAYGEVASTITATPCADMGRGTPASSGTAARIGSYTLQGQTSGPAPAFTVYTQPSTAGITTNVVTSTTFRYGWEGYKDQPSPNPDTLPGSVGIC